MKQPSNLHAKPVPACAGPASLMATVWGRDDLPPAYTPGHPRQLPDDGGASCTAWLLHPYM
jgi:hypothetical protein